MTIKYNPFRPDKMAGPGIFCGRMEELEAIDRCLLQTKNGNPQHFLVQGERGLGKSSLFLCAHFVATKKIKTIQSREFLDFITLNISLNSGDDHVSIIKRIMVQLKVELDKRLALKALALKAWDFISRIEAGGIRYNRDAENVTASELLFHLQSDFVDVISKLDKVADGILLLIDEADKPGPAANLGVICKLLSEHLTRNDCDRLCIGMAGLPNILDVLKDSHESSLRIFRIMSLKPLEPGEREEVLNAGLKDARDKHGVNMKISNDAAALISNLSEGYPHFLQEFAHCAWEEDRDNVLDKSDVANSLHKENGAFDQLGRKYFDQFYAAPDSDDYRKVLNVMAEHMDNWIDRASLIRESGLKETTVDNALRALRLKNIILQNDMKRGEYRIPTMSFAAWIKAKNVAAADRSLDVTKKSHREKKK